MIKEEWDIYINLFSQSGAIKTFNFEINKIYKFSKALFIINIIGSLISILMIFFVLLNASLIVCCDIKSCVSCFLQFLWLWLKQLENLLFLYYIWYILFC